MSFPRAKIQRFNEKPTSTPSPADYNVAGQGTTVGGNISKSGRFQVPKSPASSEQGSTKSIHSTPCFRTPTLPKKKKSVFQSPFARKAKLEDLLKESETEALKDKIVECNNKDVFIRDLSEYVEELKEQICTLTKKKAHAEMEKLKFEETAMELKEEHKMVLEKIFLEHDEEVAFFRKEINLAEVARVTAEAELIQLREEMEAFKVQVDESLEGFDTRLVEKEFNLKEAQQRVNSLMESFEQMKIKHEFEIEGIKLKHSEEIEDLQFELLKFADEVERLKFDSEEVKRVNEKRIDELTERFEQEKEVLKIETIDRIKQIEENSNEARLLSEMQLQEKHLEIELTYKLKLQQQEHESVAILKECQAISEYNIIQCELEKKEVKQLLDQKLDELNELNKENADLSILCKDLELKCRDLSESVVPKQDYINVSQSLKEALNQKKLYEISINKTHQTIETLKRRLLDSDRDVEQLSSELDRCELTRLEYEGKCNQLTDEIEQIELDYIQKLNNLQDSLITKLEEYKSTAQKEIDSLQLALAKEHNELTDTLEQLHAEHELNEKAQRLIAEAQQKLILFESQETTVLTQKNDIIEQLTKEKLKIESENEKMKLDLKKLADHDSAKLEKLLTQSQEKCETYVKYTDYYKLKLQDLENEMTDLQGINKKYIEQSGRYDELFQVVEELKKEKLILERTVAEQESLIGPFRAQLEAFEMEHNALLEQKSEAVEEAKAMGLKYAQLLGHQNQKQKIKHLMDLKYKNYELMDSNKEMKVKMATQQKLIEKLRKELAAFQSPRKSKLHQSDKENINSPNRTLTLKADSPGGPLRDRN